MYLPTGNSVPPDEDNNGTADDDHDIMTGSDTNGQLHPAGNTCEDWTSSSDSITGLLPRNEP